MGELVNGGRYTDEDRREAAIQYAIKGNMRAISREIGIPCQTLHDWKHSDWFEPLVLAARTEIEDQFKANCHQIIEHATRETLDRLEHGDEVLGKDGEPKRVKMRGKDAATIGAIYYDKLRLSMNLPTSISDRGGHKQAIANLADQFRALSESYKARNINVIAEQRPGDAGVVSAPITDNGQDSTGK